MKTKEEVMKDQQELKKLVPMKGNVLKDVPIATVSSQAATPTQVQSKGKLMPQPKPAMVAPVKQPAPTKTEGTTSPKSISTEPVKQPAPTKSQEPTNATGTKTEPTLYVHVTPANPRCGVPALSQRALEVMGQDPKNGDIFAFTDRWHKTIQVLQHNESGQSLLKKKLDERVDWPFISDDKKSTTVVFKGAAKDKFLRSLGCPNDLSR